MYIPMIKLEFILVNFQWDTLSVAYQPSDFACEEQRAVEKWYKTIQNTKIVHGKFACWTIYIYTLFFFLRLHSFVVVVVDCTEVESGSTIEVRPIYLWIGMFYFYILSLTLFCIFVFFFLSSVVSAAERKRIHSKAIWWNESMTGRIFSLSLT